MPSPAAQPCRYPSKKVWQSPGNQHPSPGGGTAGKATASLFQNIWLYKVVVEGRRKRTSGQVLCIFVTVSYSCISNTKTGLQKEQPVNGNKRLQPLAVACIPNWGLCCLKLHLHLHDPPRRMPVEAHTGAHTVCAPGSLQALSG